MDVHVKRETCPNCQSDKLYNYVKFDKSHHLAIFAECSSCGSLVARYLIQQYVDPNAPFDAFLSQVREHAGDSGRMMMVDIKKYLQNVADEFNTVRRAWRENPVKRKIYEILKDDEWGYDDYWGE